MNALVVTDDLTISGAAAATTIVDGQSLARVFQLNGPADPSNPPINVAFSGMTIQNGKATAAILGGNGGGIYSNNTNFTLSDSVIKNCTADLDGGGLYVTLSSFIIHVMPNTILDHERRHAKRRGPY